MVILGYDEVNGVIFLYADRNAYMVEADHRQLQFSPSLLHWINVV